MMHISVLITGMLVAAMSVLATPIHTVEVVPGLAGNVVDHNGTTYMLHDTESDNIRTITEKIKGEFMRPVSFHVEQSHVCRFYSEAIRGVGHLMGEYEGTYEGNFSDWAVFYECHDLDPSSTVTDSFVHDAPVLQVGDTQTPNMIPCGYTKTASGGQHYLEEGPEGHIFDFTINGESYTPVIYHVTTSCNCRFYW